MTSIPASNEYKLSLNTHHHATPKSKKVASLTYRIPKPHIHDHATTTRSPQTQDHHVTRRVLRRLAAPRPPRTPLFPLLQLRILRTGSTPLIYNFPLITNISRSTRHSHQLTPFSAASYTSGTELPSRSAARRC